MKSFFTRGKIMLLIALVALGYAAYTYLTRDTTPDWITEKVTRGEVAQIVSVSGTLEAGDEASLSFPVSGVVREILTPEGTLVVKDQILAVLEQDELIADRQDAYASLLIAEADRTELVSGPRTEAREVTNIAVDIARADLGRTIAEEAEEVRSTYRTLLSDDLEALPIDRDTNDAPPLVSGTYTCDTAGTYLLTVFRSGSQSGYSYRLSGLEEGSFTAYTEAPSPLGSCGLSIQFVQGESYSSKTWEISIPNARGASYTQNQNAYALARQGEANRVSEARQALEQALSEQSLENAIPRDEAMSRADAKVIQTKARLAAIDARISERTLRAPFPSIVSTVNITVGEVASGEAITLAGNTHFELTVRIPEIDITKIQIGQTADIVFDARSTETIGAVVGFISNTATEIDGVAYFEAKLRFDTPPLWFRSGLNADVNIIVEKQSDVLRIPKRFLNTKDDLYTVQVPDGTASRSQPIEISLTGNNGYVGVTKGLQEGDTIIAP